MVDNSWLSTLIAGKIKILVELEKSHVRTRDRLREDMHVLSKDHQKFIKDYLKYDRSHLAGQLRNWRSIKDMIKIIDDEEDEFAQNKAEAMIKIEKWFSE